MINLTEDKVINIEDIMQGNQMQAVFWSYLAGLIDGEGSFIITKTKVESISKNSKCKNDRYTPYFSIGMVDIKPLEMILDAIGQGKIYEERVQNKRSIWRIRAGGRKVLIPFLKNLIPFLIVKQKQARFLLDFCENWETPYRKDQGVSNSELQRREEAYQTMRKFNAVGAAATTKPLNTRECEAIV